ncbi:cysteine dioxygenase type I, partial [Basidiobolus meristosporus CBS 931.73]
MAELVQVIREELGDDGLDSENVDVKRVMQIMSNYQSNASDWQRYALFDKYKYTRNLVDDGNGQFNLLVLCWGEGQQSPIHDHAGSHCVMKILDGELTESQYHWPENFDESKLHGDSHNSKPMSLLQKSVYERDEVTYISDKIGLHRVSNDSPVKKAISLHLYTPPIKSCNTFCEDTSVARKSGNCVFHSIHGHR